MGGAVTCRWGPGAWANPPPRGTCWASQGPAHRHPASSPGGRKAPFWYRPQELLLSQHRTRAGDQCEGQRPDLPTPPSSREAQLSWDAPRSGLRPGVQEADSGLWQAAQPQPCFRGNVRPTSVERGPQLGEVPQVGMLGPPSRPGESAGSRLEGGEQDSPWGRTPSPAGRGSPRRTGPGTGAGCCAAGPCRSQQAAPASHAGQEGWADRAGGREGGTAHSLPWSAVPGPVQPPPPPAAPVPGPPTCRAAPPPGTASAPARRHWPSAPSPPPGCC